MRARSWFVIVGCCTGLFACTAMVSERPIRTEADLVDYLHFHPPRAPSWWGGCETGLRRVSDGGASVECGDGSRAESIDKCPVLPTITVP
jgi:hypothetical protein